MAVPALPVMEPVIVWVKVFEPEKELLSARSVEEAALAVVGHVVLQISDERQMVPKVPLVEKRFVEVALVVVELTRFGRYWSVPKVVVALIRASARASVKYRLEPSATLVVRSPRDEVASCCHPPPAYEPRRIPAAVGFVIPVPPLPAANEPVQVGVRVKAPEELVMFNPMFVSVEVARVIAPV